MKILLISKIPPPVGGVAIHTLRLINMLKKDNFDFDLVEPNKKKLFRLFISTIRAKVIHIHSLRFFAISWIYFCVLRYVFKKNIILTLHSLRRVPKLSHIIFKIPNSIICVNNQILKKISNIKGSNKGIYEISPFLPFEDSEERFFDKLNLKESLFLERGKIISFNAWKVIIENGKDIYGIDTVLEAFSKVSSIDNELKLCLCIPGLDEHGKKYICNLLEKNFIDRNRLLIIDRPVWFIVILRKSFVFIRANRSDGDPLSLKEAIKLKIPSIASDCVPRPTQVLSFSTGDSKDLANKIISLSQTKRMVFKSKIEDEENYLKIKQLYITPLKN